MNRRRCRRGASSPLVADGFFGVNAQGLRPLAEDGELDRLDLHLDEIAAGGIDFLRTNIDWPRLEPAPPGASGHVYDFEGLDRWMTAVAEHGLEWRVAVMGVPTPGWAVRPGCGQGLRPARLPRRAPPIRRARRGARPPLRSRPAASGACTRSSRATAGPRLRALERAQPRQLLVPDPRPGALRGVADAGADAILAADRERDPDRSAASPRSDTTDRRSRQRAVTRSLDFLRRMLAARPGLAEQARRDRRPRVRRPPGRRPRRPRPASAAAVDAAGLRRKPLAYNETGWYTSGLGATPPVTEEKRAAYLAAVTDAVRARTAGSTRSLPTPGSPGAGPARHRGLVRDRRPRDRRAVPERPRLPRPGAPLRGPRRGAAAERAHPDLRLSAIRRRSARGAPTARPAARRAGS